MCGVVGLLVRDHEEDRVDSMLARVGHRGPDASGLKSLRGCHLGHARLRIIDLSRAADQPMSNEDGSVWVVFNGEIYNFVELRAGLESAGHQFRTATDTEVLIHLYEDHGDRLAEHLRGMFAFAIWDEPAQRLLLCRDRLGIKPLYFRENGPELSFASEMQALRRPSDCLDVDSLHGYLLLGWVPGPTTIVEGVVEVPPAHVIVWEGGRRRDRRYWTPPFCSGRPSPQNGELAEALTDAMKLHVVADVPVGLFLSSGIDSVVVAELAKSVSPDIRAYTVSFEGGIDEAPEAASLAGQLGVDHTVVTLTGEEVLRSLDTVIADMDQPTVDGVNSWMISRAVRDAGLVVALSGLGGDEVFAGYSTFRHVPSIQRAGRRARSFPAALRSLPDWGIGRVRRTAHSRSRRAWEAVANGGWSSAYQAVRGLFGARELESVWEPAREHGDAELVRMPWEHGLEGPAMVAQLELANYLPFQLLRDTDAMSMAHALEVRVPLLDDRVVELAVAGQVAEGTAWGKQRLLAAVDPKLAYLADRSKKTFTLPFDAWMRGPLRERVLGALVHLGDSDLGFDRRELTAIWSAYVDGHVGWRPVWALAVLGMWIELHPALPHGGRVPPQA